MMMLTLSLLVDLLNCMMDQLLVDLLVKLMISTNNDQWLVDLLVAGADRVPPLPPSKHQSPKPEWHHADHDHHDHPNDDDDHHHNHHDNDDDYHGEDDHHHEDDDSEAPIDQAKHVQSCFIHTYFKTC